MTTRTKKHSGDVQWYVSPTAKRPIASCTTASSNLIAMLWNDGYRTPRSIHAAINFDDEAKAVMQAFMDAGVGDVPLFNVQ